eukprot:1159209-Pelagomonas_calceolata.AAC.9
MVGTICFQQNSLSCTSAARIGHPTRVCPSATSSCSQPIASSKEDLPFASSDSAAGLLIIGLDFPPISSISLPALSKGVAHLSPQNFLIAELWTARPCAQTPLHKPKFIVLATSPHLLHAEGRGRGTGA